MPDQSFDANVNNCFELFATHFFTNLPQISHVYGFSFSWTAKMWVCSWFVLEKPLSHLSHLNLKFFSWIWLMWSFKCTFVEDLYSHLSHWKGFFFSWTISICVCSRHRNLYILLQIEHWYLSIYGNMGCQVFKGGIQN
jgi:hypothetical protein